VYAASAVLAIPPLIGAIRTAGRLGFLLATRALPKADPRKVDMAAAPRRALIVMLELAIVILLGAPLLAVTQIFLPPYYGGPLLVALIIVLGMLFWKSAADLQGHVKAATQIIAEALAERARKGASSDADVRHSLDEIQTHLPGLGTPTTVRLNEGSYATGKSLAELNLRGLTGASVLAIDRAGGQMQVPSARERLTKDDLLVLAGTEEAIAAGAELLERGPQPA
jgi:monovalent cation:H+ antiporter-2, CPA2 family